MSFNKKISVFDTVFSTISSGTCESHGMRIITSKVECEDAAEKLGLADTSIWCNLQEVHQFASRPIGCIYASIAHLAAYWLCWAPPVGHPGATPGSEVSCGSDHDVYDGYEIECICTSGKI